FAFGLVHGLGFASGLASLGLPSGDIPVALLFFNLGVEAGQLSFVALMLLLVRGFDLLEIHWPQPARMVPAYVVGSVGAFWTIDRIVAMIAGTG
ncbi:MAG: HupE/UreJ family protein, partial [Bradyrhizobium sp.]